MAESTDPVRTARARLAGHTVLVRAPRRELAELARLGAPFLELDQPVDGERAVDQLDAGGRVPVVRVEGGDSPSVAGCWRQEVTRSAYEPDRVLWVDDEPRRVTVCGPASQWRSQQVLRTVRHLLRWQAWARGDLLLHGGLVRLDGRGVVVIGAKRSGKTSTVLSAMVHAGADFVSNDDVTLTAGAPADPAALSGYGWPRTVNVRTDSLLALVRTSPELRERVQQLLAGAGHPTNRFEGRHRTAEAVPWSDGRLMPGSWWLRCAELAAVTRSRLVRASRVQAVLLPRFVDGPARLVDVDGSQARELVAVHVEQQGTRYDPFLADWFTVEDARRRAGLLDRLLADVPVLRLEQSMTALDQGTRLVRQWVSEAPQPGGRPLRRLDPDLDLRAGR